ncbi:nitroreductase/quinone reductase family protein [Streptomyces sp. NRRL F-2580]|uniref:nitroreductase/quinone reductase family protein n=1 Tax=Streptomyces sp. NRRL F-2580 TaxID=1463841 RepID=UPI000689FDB4|nr:nitroreductase/quinone reductase family protein [Streptomyces sp. NRRL F-2580]
MTTAPYAETATATATATATDSPNAWVAAHIRRFEETAGQPRPGISDLLLTTRGRRSGLLRRTALAYVRDGADGGDGAAYVLTASNAGADRHPAWYLNLAADPAVTLQVGAETFPATARRATPAEAERLWPVVVAAMPSYAAYRAATAREIPLVLVTRTGGGGVT